MDDLEAQIGPDGPPTAADGTEPAASSTIDTPSAESSIDTSRETARRIVRDLDYRHRQREYGGRSSPPTTRSAVDSTDIATAADSGLRMWTPPSFAPEGIEEVIDELERKIDRWFKEKRREREKAGEWAKIHRHQRWDTDVRRYLAREHGRAEQDLGSAYRAEMDGRRPTPSSSEFLRQTQGNLPKNLFVETDRFLALPRRVVDDIINASYGGLTYSDSVRLELAVLSYLAGLAAEQPEDERTIEYAHGDTVSLEGGEVIISMQKAARALYQRFYYSPTYNGSTTANDQFHAFYRTVTNVFKRLSDSPVLDHLGPAIDTGDRRSDAYGQRFRVNIPNLCNLPLGLPSPSLSLSRPAPASSYDERFVDGYSMQLDDRTEIVDVPALFDALVWEHTGQWDTFTEQAAKSTQASECPADTFRTAERAVKGFDWQRRQARPSTVEGGVNSRHVTTGAYKEGYAKHEERTHLPCAVPFIVLEIDGETAELCLSYTRKIVRWLESMAVPLDVVTVTYTGNTSFHIRLPAGLFGKPIFRSTRQGTKTIKRFYELVEESIDSGEGAWIDGALSSPLHHIRAIGSVHEGLYSRSGRERHCVGFTAEEILDYPLGAIQQYSIHYSGYTLPDPAKAPRHEGLVQLLLEAHNREKQTVEIQGNRRNRGIIERILEDGVEKGKEFGPGLVGRNLAARLVSLHLLQSGLSHQDTWLAVTDWNEKNGPPLGEAPDDHTGELRYVFDRAAGDAPHL